MKSKMMKAARMHELLKPLVLEEVPVPEIQPDEVLVRITAAGTFTLTAGMFFHRDLANQNEFIHLLKN